MNNHARAVAASAIVLLAAACSEPNTAPTSAGTELDASAVKFWEAGATTAWNELATSLADRVAIDQGRMYAYLGLAQYRAAQAANGINPHRPTAAAIGGASAAVLNAFFPANTTEIEAALDAQEAADPWPGAKHANFVVGEALGREVGAKVLTFAAGDRAGLAQPGTPPIGDGYWRSSGAALVRGLYRARPFYLASDSQFRPAPPAAFGSAAFQAALAEVRQISDTRTAEQLAIATYWNIQQSGRRNAPFNNKAVELIRKYHIQDAEAARIMFLDELGGLRWQHRLLRCEVSLLVHPAAAGGPGHHDPGRVAEPPVVSLGTFVRLGVGERRADGVFPRRCGPIRRHVDGGEPLEALCRDPLPVRHGARIALGLERRPRKALARPGRGGGAAVN